MGRDQQYVDVNWATLETSVKHLSVTVSHCNINLPV